MHLLRQTRGNKAESEPVIVASNPVVTRKWIRSEYLDRLRSSLHSPDLLIEVETQADIAEYEKVLEDGVARYQEKTDSAVPHNITIIGGDRTVAGAMAVLHKRRKHNTQGYALPVDAALAQTALAIIPAGNGNDRAKELLLAQALKVKTCLCHGSGPGRAACTQ